jgi:hypothetical protein
VIFSLQPHQGIICDDTPSSHALTYSAWLNLPSARVLLAVPLPNVLRWGCVPGSVRFDNGLFFSFLLLHFLLLLLYGITFYLRVLSNLSSCCVQVSDCLLHVMLVFVNVFSIACPRVHLRREIVLF